VVDADEAAEDTGYDEGSRGGVLAVAGGFLASGGVLAID